jgi:predicted house-cleaning noncanonical NTP pyrophosphatase (MazG superfamily)
MLEINTGARRTNNIIKVDGIEMIVKPAGAGTTLALMQKQKLMKTLQNKKEDATEADMEKMAEIMQNVIDFYKSIFTGDQNKEEVAKWVESQDFETLQYVMEQVNNAQNGQVQG